MAGIATGMALHGGVLPFAATFFTFSDYMRPSIRLAALSKAHVIYVWTHDSIGLPIADRKRNFAVVVDFSCDATFVMIG